MTAIRQSIASSIVLIAIIVFNESSRRKLVKFVAIVLVATLFHKGAFAAFLFLPVYYLKKPKQYNIASISVCLVFIISRSFLMTYIRDIFDKDTLNTNAGLYVGLNAIFLIALFMMFVFAGKNRELVISEYPEDYSIEEVFSIEQFEKLYGLGVAVLFLFGSDTSVRSAMVLYQVMIVLLPNELEFIFNDRSKKIFSAVAVVFFIVFLFTNSLIPNSLYLVPYRFFWQTGVR